MSLLALSVQVFGTAKIVAKISAGSFYPAPKVDSAVIRVDLYPEPLVEAAMLDRFFQLTRAGFGQKRKMLRKSLAAGLSLPVPVVEDMLLQNEIDPTRRAETLSLDEWGKLTEYYDELIARSW
jgi:16S rRNA (adenine1518-N6/adenine1519-N6)-dimethyltransferase